jgi:hypothetical protein
MNLTTRDGTPARIICTNAAGDKPIIAIIYFNGTEIIERFTANGFNIQDGVEHELDLMFDTAEPQEPSNAAIRIAVRQYFAVYDNDELDVYRALLNASGNPNCVHGDDAIKLAGLKEAVVWEPFETMELEELIFQIETLAKDITENLIPAQGVV